MFVNFCREYFIILLIAFHNSYFWNFQMQLCKLFSQSLPLSYLEGRKCRFAFYFPRSIDSSDYLKYLDFIFFNSVTFFVLYFGIF